MANWCCRWTGVAWGKSTSASVPGVFIYAIHILSWSSKSKLKKLRYISSLKCLLDLWILPVESRTSWSDKADMMKVFIRQTRVGAPPAFNSKVKESIIKPHVQLQLSIEWCINHQYRFHTWRIEDQLHNWHFWRFGTRGAIFESTSVHWHWTTHEVNNNF